VASELSFTSTQCNAGVTIFVLSSSRLNDILRPQPSSSPGLRLLPLSGLVVVALVYKPPPAVFLSLGPVLV